jgi:hypothetical protein
MAISPIVQSTASNWRSSNVSVGRIHPPPCIRWLRSEGTRSACGLHDSGEHCRDGPGGSKGRIKAGGEQGRKKDIAAQQHAGPMRMTAPVAS